MITRLRLAIHWVRALRHSRSGSLDEAMVQIDKMGALAPLRPLELAFKSELLLRQHKFEEAEELWDVVARLTDDAADPRARYINFWVRSIRARIEGDHALNNYFVREAGKLPVSQTLRDWLTLPD